MSDAPAAPPCPAEGAVSWNLTTACNYRCSYCTQRSKADRGREPRPAAEFLAAFRRLPGRWEVKLSGGEPFAHPELDGITASLAEAGHRISIVTNFSTRASRLESFVAAAQGRLGVFSCSLHLEHVPDVAGFLDRAAALQELLDRHRDPALPRPRVCVTAVATRALLQATYEPERGAGDRSDPAPPRVAALAGLASDRGLPFKLQPEKQEREVIAYTAREAELLLALGGHNLTGRIVHRFGGRPCWSGSRYFILDDQGVCFRCYPARRWKRERMGSFLAPGFRLSPGPSPCQYDTCNCTVPIARGMMPIMDHERPARADEDLS